MTSWYDRLFVKEVNEEYKIQLIKDLKEEFQKFYNEYDDTETNKLEKELNDWYYSEEGQKQLLKFVQDFWNKLNNKSHSAMPAHDSRHALFKVPTYSLKYIVSENVQGWERIGVIGALGHDFGRWAEERIFDNAQDGSAHSRMSYVLLKEFIEDYHFPNQIKKTILNSVLKHTTGANSEESMPIKLTVSPDRDQLVGPEMILRIIHHKPKEDALNVFFDEPNHKSIISAIVRMYFSRLPGPLFSLNNELRESFKITLTFCLMNVGMEKIMEYKNAFIRGNFNEDLFQEDLSFAFKEIEKINMYSNKLNVENELLKLISSKNTCPEDEYKKLSLKKLEKLSEIQKLVLAKSLYWVNEQKEILDNQQYDFLTTFKFNINEQWLKWLASTLVKEGF